MSYKGLSQKKMFVKEKAEHPSFTNSQVNQIVLDHEKKSISDIAGADVTPKQKYDYFAKQIFIELKKPSPDYQAIAYYRGEMARIPKGHLVPVFKKKD